jgi:peptidoglycan hydrolase-like protein with peptidoglycan-binding domain
MSERSLYLTCPPMQGDDVKWLQNKLCHRGYWMEQDGVFGEVTEQGLVNFQASHGLKADGVLGSKTRGIL